MEQAPLLQRSPMVRARTSPTREERIARGLKRVERVAWLLDDSIRVPIVGVRFGLDAVLGFVPGVGDVLGALLGLYPILEAVNLRAPRRIVGKMVRNLILDLLVGLVPVIGDTMDAMMKVNQRNLALLRDHFAHEAPARRGWLARLLGPAEPEVRSRRGRRATPRRW